MNSSCHFIIVVLTKSQLIWKHPNPIRILNCIILVFSLHFNFSSSFLIFFNNNLSLIQKPRLVWRCLKKKEKRKREKEGKKKKRKRKLKECALNLRKFFLVPEPQVCVRGYELSLHNSKTTHWRETEWNWGKVQECQRNTLGCAPWFIAKTLDYLSKALLLRDLNIKPI